MPNRRGSLCCINPSALRASPFQGEQKSLPCSGRLPECVLWLPCKGSCRRRRLRGLSIVACDTTIILSSRPPCKGRWFGLCRTGGVLPAALTPLPPAPPPIPLSGGTKKSPLTGEMSAVPTEGFLPTDRRHRPLYQNRPLRTRPRGRSISFLIPLHRTETAS